MLMYYVSLKPGYWKTFGTPFESFWCCTGTGVEEYSKANDAIYSHDADSLYVNLFIGSELQWPQKKLSVVQETNFPQEEGTTLTLNPQKPTEMVLKIRIPYWATKNVVIKVNGKTQNIATEPSTYAEIKRRWVKGDKVEVSLPMSLHSSPLPDDHTVQAAMYGPLVLAAQMGREGLTHERIYGPNGPRGRDMKQLPMPEVSSTDGNASSSVEAVPGQKLKFRTIGQPEGMHLIPLYQLMDERYSVYWKVNRKTV